MKTLLATAALLALGTIAAAQEVTLDQVPANVLETANAHAMGLSWTRVSLDGDTYEFEATTAEGLHYEVDVTVDGELDEIEQEVTGDAIPQPVLDALAANAAGFVATLVEMSTRPDGSVVYEMEGTRDGVEVAIDVSADGTGFEMEEGGE
jgi:hypothetical protein